MQRGPDVTSRRFREYGTNQNVTNLKSENPFNQIHNAEGLESIVMVMCFPSRGGTLK